MFTKQRKVDEMFPDGVPLLLFDHQIILSNLESEGIHGELTAHWVLGLIFSFYVDPATNQVVGDHHHAIIHYQSPQLPSSSHLRIIYRIILQQWLSAEVHHVFISTVKPIPSRHHLSALTNPFLPSSISFVIPSSFILHHSYPPPYLSLDHVLIHYHSCILLSSNIQLTNFISPLFHTPFPHHTQNHTHHIFSLYTTTYPFHSLCSFMHSYYLYVHQVHLTLSIPASCPHLPLIFIPIIISSHAFSLYTTPCIPINHIPTKPMFSHLCMVMHGHLIPISWSYPFHAHIISLPSHT